MKKYFVVIIILILVLPFLYLSVEAQSNVLSIDFSRDFGYAAIGSNTIQGLFSITASSTINLKKVSYYLDNVLLGEATSKPYKIQFNTDSFSEGQHSIHAEGETFSGEIIRSEIVTFVFISAEASRKETLKIIGPLLGLVLVVTLLSAIVPAVFRKNKTNIPMGTQRNYGIAGGAICSKCKRPFERHVMSPNLIMGKLEICPHCGKWGIYRALPLNILRDAELKEIEDHLTNADSVVESDTDDQLKKKLDESRFED